MNEYDINLLFVRLGLVGVLVLGIFYLVRLQFPISRVEFIYLTAAVMIAFIINVAPFLRKIDIRWISDQIAKRPIRRSRTET